MTPGTPGQLWDASSRVSHAAAAYTRRPPYTWCTVRDPYVCFSACASQMQLSRGSTSPTRLFQSCACRLRCFLRFLASRRTPHRHRLGVIASAGGDCVAGRVGTIRSARRSGRDGEHELRHQSPSPPWHSTRLRPCLALCGLAVCLVHYGSLHPPDGA